MGADGPPRRERFVASEADAGRRLDRFLAARLPALSRTYIQRLIREGHVEIRPGRARAATAVAPGQTVDVEVPPPAPATPAPQSLPLPILYDDADLVVIDKPAGMVVHPGAGHGDGTLVNALLHHVTALSGIGGVERPGIVHRLDKGTSGVMVVAKHDAAHRELARQFHDREVEKEYVALVWGGIGSGLDIDRPIGRDRRRRTRMSSRTSRSRPATTHVTEAERLGPVTLVRLRIGTGRTHQIRVHLSEIGHPIVGDVVYGGVRRRVPSGGAPAAALARPFLHAARLAFRHPRTGAPVAFEAPLPGDLDDVLSALRARAVPR